MPQADMDVVVLDEPPTIPARTKKRTFWTDEMNEYLVRCFLTITKLETLPGQYSKDVHRMVVEKFPDISHKTVQNIIDQKRSIFRNNRLPADTINRIRREVAIELGMVEENEDTAEEGPQNMSMISADGVPNQTLAEEEFHTQYTMYSGMDPNTRPRLPKLRERANSAQITEDINNIIRKLLTDTTNILELHTILYVGAATVLTLHGQRLPPTAEHGRKQKKSEKKTPAWERRIIDKINVIRADIAILTQSKLPNASNRLCRRAAAIKGRHTTSQNPGEQEIIDLLKQKLAAISTRLQRYRKSNKRREQNHLFAVNERSFYQSLGAEPAQRGTTEQPEQGTMREYWENIWSVPAHHAPHRWINEQRAANSNLRTMLDWRITLADVQKAISRTHSWKAPGRDKLQNYWLKKFTATHEKLAQLLLHLLQNPEETPQFLTSGITYLLPKTTTPSADPARYRPITCLPTLYKLLTATIADKIYQHLQKNNLLDEEQKGCRKGSRGCKEQLILDSVVTGNARKSKNNLYTAYVDYKKAFDSVPHSWLLETLKLHKIDRHIVTFLQHVTTMWNTTLTYNANGEQIQAGHVQIKRGIFQGDALSPLWFCLAVRPLTVLLNNMHRGYTLKDREISHLWYMDDLKLYSRKEEHLQQLLDAVGRFSTDIRMQFGLDKCRTNYMVKGKWAEKKNYDVSHQGIVEGMDKNETYVYLGYAQARGIDHKQCKEDLRNTYLSRLRSILKTELSARNTTKAVNSYATSVLTYSFGVLTWTDTELKELDILTRKEFRRQRGHHPHSAVERFHLPRKYGGRGIPSAVTRHYQQVINLRKYFYEKGQTSPIHQAAILADRALTPLNLANRNVDCDSKIYSISDLKQNWKAKPLHGKYMANIEQPHIDTEASTAWLRKGALFKETEGFITSIQDQVVPTRAYRKRILKEVVPTVSCRMCGEYEESLDHIMAGCPVMAHKQYLDRHNKAACIIHQELRVKFMGLQERVPYYKYDPAPVCEDEEVRLYWNRPIVTDKTISNNIPDIVLTLKNERITYVIDIAVPLPANIIKTHREKINKYLPLADEIKKMWRMDKVQVIPIVIGCTGEIPKSLWKSLEDLQLDRELYTPIQRAVLLHTCHVVRRVLGEV